MDFNDEHYDEYSVLAYKYSLLSIRSQYANSKAYRNFGVISERRQQFEQAEEAYRTSMHVAEKWSACSAPSVHL